MSGICSAHQGHDPHCRLCRRSPSEQLWAVVSREQVWYEAARHEMTVGYVRGFIEAGRAKG
jgi:hypothetical protein